VGEETPDEPRHVAVFDSIHYVLAAERVFRERGVSCDLVPTPRRISSDCGMVIEFRESDLDCVRRILAEPQVKARAVYRPAEGAYEAVSI
jgi:hypothetical protein